MKGILHNAGMDAELVDVRGLRCASKASRSEGERSAAIRRANGYVVCDGALGEGGGGRRRWLHEDISWPVRCAG